MKLLLDTHILLWAAGEPEKLSEEARLLLSDPNNSLFFSAASIWEIVIKNALGREDFKIDPCLLEQGLRENGYRELPIGAAHALTVGNLPSVHKDPFDRILLAQAMVENLLLLTSDPLLSLIHI